MYFSTVPISIIIATYNRGSILKDTLACLLEQKPMPLEILVIDQSETVDDEVSDFLSTLEVQGKISWLRQSPPNAQVARNRGLREAKGGVVLFLDDDIECGPNLVGAHWKNYDDPLIAAVSGMILEPGQLPTVVFPDRFYGTKLGWMFFPLNYGMRVECINLSSCNASVRREVALKAGGFDENFIRTLYDDSDFSWRVHLLCRDLGLQAIHDPQACLTHFRVRTGGKRPTAMNEFVIADDAKWENLFYFHLKHWGLEALGVMAKRYRWWIWHRKNILRPWWLVVSHVYLALGLFKAVKRIVQGPKLLPCI
jgi:glycosyltransferase involved in cell wall biosynthesis